MFIVPKKPFQFLADLFKNFVIHWLIIFNFTNIRYLQLLMLKTQKTKANLGSVKF